MLQKRAFHLLLPILVPLLSAGIAYTLWLWPSYLTLGLMVALTVVPAGVLSWLVARRYPAHLLPRFSSVLYAVVTAAGGMVMGMLLATNPALMLSTFDYTFQPQFIALCTVIMAIWQLNLLFAASPGHPFWKSATAV